MAMKQGELPATIPQVFEHEQFGKIRVIGDTENPRFCLADVCKVLEIGNPSDVKRRLGDGVVSIEVITDSLGRTQSATFINEDGLYDVILDSRKPEAKRFRKWITAEVIPSIRKTGVYMTTEAAEEIISNPDFIIGLAQQVKRARAERDAALAQAAVLSTQVAELQPKANYYDLILNCKDLVSTSKIAKDYGMSAVRFNRLLKSLGVQYNQSGVWLLYQKYAGQGWSSTKTHNYLGSDSKTHCKVHTYWTPKGRLGLYDLLKKNGHLPTVERED